MKGIVKGFAMGFALSFIHYFFVAVYSNSFALFDLYKGYVEAWCVCSMVYFIFSIFAFTTLSRNI